MVDVEVLCMMLMEVLLVVICVCDLLWVENSSFYVGFVLDGYVLLVYLFWLDVLV